MKIRGLLLALALGGCTSPLTQLVVVVHTDLEVPAEITSIDLEVQGPSGEVTTQSAALSGQDAVLSPLALTLTPATDTLGPVTITAIARHDGAEVARRVIRTNFVRNESRMVMLLLLQSCLGVECGADRTCTERGCRSVNIPGDELPVWPGELGSVLNDGGQGANLDAGVDGGPGTDTGVPNDDGGSPGGLIGDEVALGSYHSCAIRNGSVLCWGRNDWGQLGDGTTTSRSTPTAVPGLQNVAAIAAGRYHTCAVTEAGTVYCWGQNDRGQLGNGTKSSAPMTQPQLVEGASDVSLLAAGGVHTCALTVEGVVLCWGAVGQVGRAVGSDQSTAGVVDGISAAIMVTAGGLHSCAVLTNGNVACWGRNDVGQFGNGSTIDSATPATSSVTNVMEVRAGDAHTCARLVNGEVYCWGQNIHGQAGDGTVTPSNQPKLSPVRVGTLTGVTNLGVGGYHACAAQASSSGVCWGLNREGQLGSNTGTNDNPNPVPINGATISEFFAGSFHACGTTPSGLVCWGSNTYGQLGCTTCGTETTQPQLVLP